MELIILKLFPIEFCVHIVLEYLIKALSKTLWPRDVDNAIYIISYGGGLKYSDSITVVSGLLI
jgi:hypothetical protein